MKPSVQHFCLSSKKKIFLDLRSAKETKTDKESFNKIQTYCNCKLSTNWTVRPLVQWWLPYFIVVTMNPLITMQYSKNNMN